MIARFGSGLEITLCRKDKIEVEEKGSVECRLTSWQKPKLIVHVVDNVPKGEYLESKGFHIEVTPPNGGPKIRTQYDVYLSREKFKELITPKGDSPVKQDGYAGFRTVYDRVDINYWDC